MRRLDLLRKAMLEARLDAYLVPSTDPHQSEYVPDCWQRRRWISGFTGSAGDIVVTRRRAGLWTDGRYALQAERELAGSGITLFVSGRDKVPELSVWLRRTLRQNEVLGVDPQLLSPFVEQRLRGALSRCGARLALVRPNLVDRLWHDRPSLPSQPARPHPLRFAGESVASKLRRVRKRLAEAEADVYPLVPLDEMAWLFNLRGDDVSYNPLLIGYGLVTMSRALLFCDTAKLDSACHRHLERSQIELYDYRGFGPALQQLAQASGRLPRVWIDERRCSSWVVHQLARCPLLRAPSPLAALKAQKNETEIAGARTAQRRDGIAMVRFLCWLEQAISAQRVTELDAAHKLRSLRAAQPHFHSESFAPIIGYRANAAIVHYSASKRSNAQLQPRGLLLVDSGGQYADGTTDITRTVLLGGTASRRQREHFTRVLKGHIALSRARFPSGTSGHQLDAIARTPLWQAGLDYAHGTGHGVGAYLGVHEGPQSIGKRGTSAPLEPGNILSNEPGYYEPGSHGIRIENLLLVVRDEQRSRPTSPFLRFEVLTLCPIDRRLVDTKLLTPTERDWLNRYHARVRRELAPQLDRTERQWLRHATQAL